MNLKNIIDKIDKQIKFANSGHQHSYFDNTFTDQFWNGYKEGLEYAKDLLNQKIEQKKNKSNSN
jgi:hypothetical protein